MSTPRRWLLLLAFCAASSVYLATTASAADDDRALRAAPGYVDPTTLDLFQDEELKIHVSVKGPLLKLVAGATRKNDPELSAMIDRLLAIEVRAFTVADGKRAAVRRFIDKSASELRVRGWSSALTVRLEHDHGHVLLRIVDDEPVGLAAFYLEENGEAIFLNIVGPIDAAEVGRLASRFNVEGLEPEKPDG